LDIIPKWWSNNLDGRCVMFENPRSVITSKRLQGSKLYIEDMFRFVHASVKSKKHMWKVPCNLYVYCVLLHGPHPKNINISVLRETCQTKTGPNQNNCAKFCIYVTHNNSWSIHIYQLHLLKVCQNIKGF